MKKEKQNVEEIPAEETAPEAVEEESAGIPIEFLSEEGFIGKTELSFDPELLSGDSAVYNHELAQFCSQFAMLGYGLMSYDVPAADTGSAEQSAESGDEPAPETTAEESDSQDSEPGARDLKPQPAAALEAIGMTDIVTVSDTDIDQVNYFIARREITLKGKDYVLVFAGFIGSWRGQWYTNFDPGRGSIHKGFADAADFAYDGLHRYLEKIGAERENIKLLLTGHSRGGAVANLLGARFIRDRIYALPENVYTYTFAAPNGVLWMERTQPAYHRIFNIVNNEDFVTKVMPSVWGFGKYGTTLAFPEKNSSKEWKALLKTVREKMYAFSGYNYKPFPYGRRPSDKVVEAITKKIDNTDGFYDTLFRSQGEKISVQEYFIRTVCRICAEPDGTEESKSGTMYMLGTFLNRGTSSGELRDIADFFAIYEGIGSATTRKVSDMYFSYAHLAHTYCAFMLSINKEDLIP